MNHKKFIEDTLISATKYSGNMDPFKKEISASMLGNDMLQIYLKYMNGGKESNKFGASEFGSVFHIAAEHIFKDKDNIETEKSMSVMLPNGWKVTGTADLILHDYKRIVDWKVSTATTISKVQKEGIHNGYALQQAVYKYLLYKTENVKYNASLAIIDKGYSLFKKTNKTNQLNIIDIDTHTIEDIEALLIEKTNLLQEYIDAKETPPQCNDLWWFGFGAQPKKKMRCLHFCDQSNNCPYLTDHNVMKNLLENL